MAKCYNCGMEYGCNSWIEAVIPDHIWYLISPTGGQGGILCIACMAAKLKEMGLEEVPVWLCGMEPFKTYSGDPKDNLYLLRNLKPEDVRKSLKECPV